MGKRQLETRRRTRHGAEKSVPRTCQCSARRRESPLESTHEASRRRYSTEQPHRNHRSSHDGPDDAGLHIYSCTLADSEASAPKKERVKGIRQSERQQSQRAQREGGPPQTQ